jgi:hypothetical protein
MRGLIAVLRASIETRLGLNHPTVKTGEPKPITSLFCVR